MANTISNTQIFGSSGVRGIVDKEFLQQAHHIGLVTGHLYRKVLIGRDTRTSSEAMKFAFISGLLAAGSQAFDAGLVTTPTLAYCSRHFDAGAMITASHNPPEYNGIKLFNPDGSSFAAVQREQIEDAISCQKYGLAAWQEMKACLVYQDPVGEHLDRILADINPQTGLKVVLDCGGGAACRISSRLLHELGCDVVQLHCQPSGHFKRKSEPTPENLQDLIKTVKDTGAALGIAHDGDADRVVVIDDRARYVPGDKLVALLARDMEAKNVVTTVDASILIDEMGFKVTRTRVGDAFVSEEMINSGDFGGEPSGCYIFPSVSLCPDAIYAAARIVRIAKRTKISSLVDEIPSYPMLRGSVTVGNGVMANLPGVLRNGAASIDRSDGLKVLYNDGWLLVRPSGTEPKIRITAEAKTEQRASELYNFAVRAIKECEKA